MELQMQASQVVGLSDEKRWSQTFAEGNILIALELTSDGSFSAKEQGGLFLQNLADLLKKRQPQDKQAFQLLVSQFITQSFIQDKITSLVVGMYLKDTVFLYIKANGCVLIKRGDLWSELISGDGLVSGLLQDKDLLIFATQTFKKLLPYERVMERFTSSEDPVLTSEKIGALLHNFDDSKGAAAVFARFDKGDEENYAEELPTATIDNQPKQQEQEPKRLYQVEEVDKVTSQADQEQKNESPVPEPIEDQNDVSFNNKTVSSESPRKPLNRFFTGLGGLRKNLIKLPFKKTDYKEEAGLGYQKSFFAEMFGSPKRRVLVFALVLTLILTASIFIGVNNAHIGSSTSGISDATIESISRKIEEGEALTDLNSLRSKTLLSEAETDLLAIRDKYKKGSKEKIKVEELLTKTQELLATVSKIYKIDSPSVFLDLTVIKSGALAQNFSLYEDKMAVLDTANTSVFSVNIDSLSSEVVGGGSKTPQPKFISQHGDNIFILTSDGLVRLDTVSKSQQVIVKNLGDISVTDLVAFAGNVYLLDGTQGSIYKIMAVEGGYSEPKDYLAAGEKIGLSNPVSMAIDGSIWVLGDNTVQKFTRGAPQLFALDGLDDSLSGPGVLFTDDESENLYILDKGNNRVVVFDKEGKYYSQYVWPGVSGVSDMVVSEKDRKIFLLAGSLIYAIDLR